MPMKRREAWLDIQKTNKFPELWPMHPACARLERMLGTTDGRLKILTCIKAGVGLSGDPRNPQVRGIEECHVVVDELARIKTEKLKAAQGGNDADAGAGGVAPQLGGGVSDAGAGAGGVVPGAGNNVPGEDADGLSFLEDAEHHRDPVDQKANELALKEMMHINHFDELPKLLDEVEETVSREPFEQPHKFRNGHPDVNVE